MTTHPCDILPSLEVPSSVTHPTVPELKVCEISVGKLPHTSCVNGTQGYNTLLSEDRNSEIMTAIPGESLMWILIKIHTDLSSLKQLGYFLLSPLRGKQLPREACQIPKNTLGQPNCP